MDRAIGEFSVTMMMWLAACTTALATAAASWGQDAALAATVPQEPERRAYFAAIGVQQHTPHPIARLQAPLVFALAAPEAGHAAAADAAHVYGVTHFVIGQYAKTDGSLTARWVGDSGGPIAKLSSCIAREAQLWCANTNHHHAAIASSIEVFDTTAMRHAKSISLGLRPEGALVWFDAVEGGWLAGFTDADGASVVVRFDADWRRVAGWVLPETVTSSLTADGVTGGGVGPEGLLYLMGGARGVLFAMAQPAMGPTLVHVATIALDAHAQAFAWDPAAARVVYAVDHRQREVRGFDIPEVTVDPNHGRAFVRR